MRSQPSPKRRLPSSAAATIPGTNAKEKTIWTAAKITPSGAWYQTTGQGMGETLTITDQKGGYTLSDRATYLSKKASLKLEILVEGDKALFNQYHVITVKAAKNVQGGVDFMNWITSDSVQKDLIAKFGADKYGQALFVPNAGLVPRIGRRCKWGRLAVGEAPLFSPGWPRFECVLGRDKAGGRSCGQRRQLRLRSDVDVAAGRGHRDAFGHGGGYPHRRPGSLSGAFGVGEPQRRC